MRESTRIASAASSALPFICFAATLSPVCVGSRWSVATLEKPYIIRRLLSVTIIMLTLGSTNLHADLQSSAFYKTAISVHIEDQESLSEYASKQASSTTNGASIEETSSTELIRRTLSDIRKTCAKEATRPICDDARLSRLARTGTHEDLFFREKESETRPRLEIFPGDPVPPGMVPRPYLITLSDVKATVVILEDLVERPPNTYIGEKPSSVDRGYRMSKGSSKLFDSDSLIEALADFLISRATEEVVYGLLRLVRRINENTQRR